MNRVSSWFAGELYDEFNYQAYWERRKYENISGKYALKTLLDKINLTCNKKLIDIGAGFGRLADVYGQKFKHATLVDPSIKNLEIAKKKFGTKNFSYIDSIGSRLPFEDESFDVAILVRVIHHLENPKKVLGEINRVLKVKGWLIMEFANKQHFKAAFLKPKTRVSLDPIDISEEDSTLPFRNYHPKWVISLLNNLDFEIVEKLSVSNFRSQLVKKIAPYRILLLIERLVQKPFGYFNFGPSIYLLAKKAGA
jgi:ubiquinone/menaquinone biosynthesis C-methylase UbiE